MKFRIIWIDDSKTWVRSVRSSLEDAFILNKFEPVIDVFQEVDPAREVIANNYVDLIIVDCNLPNGMNGDEFIKELRSNRCFAHIIFYSNAEKNLQILIEDKHFLHITHRDNISDTLDIVAEQAFRKYRHPAFMRGLLISEFIDLENLMEDLIVQCFKDEGGYFRHTILNRGGESYSLSSKDKFIRGIINDVKEKDKSFNQQFEDIGLSGRFFQEKIIKRRNILAHARPEYDSENGKIILISSSPEVNFDGDWFHETREYIHTYKNKLRKIIDLDLHLIVNP